MKINLTFIRNGFTENQKERLSSKEAKIPAVPDEPLCPDSAREISARVGAKIYPLVSRVYTSPLRRCAETAELIYGEFPLIRKEAAVFNLGKYNGERYGSFKEEPAYQEWAQAEDVRAFPDGEEPHVSAYRMIREFRDIIGEMEENEIESATIVTNRAMIQMVVNEFQSRNFLYWDGDIPYGGVCTGTIDTYTWQLSLEKIM